MLLAGDGVFPSSFVTAVPIHYDCITWQSARVVIMEKKRENFARDFSCV